MSVRWRRPWRMTSCPAANGMRCGKPSIATLSPSRILSSMASARLRNCDMSWSAGCRVIYGRSLSGSNAAVAESRIGPRGSLMNLISTEPIFHIYAELADIRDFGHTPLGDRRVIDILGGRVDGPKLSGRILPGADWQIVWPDGTADLTARYGIETDAGARVLVRSDGLRHGPPDVLAALARGESVDENRYYFRTVMRFEASDPSVHWLTPFFALPP